LSHKRVKGKSTKIFQDITDLPFYDNMLKDPAYFRRAKGLSFKIKKVRPDDYIKESAKIHGGSVEAEYQMINRKLVGDYVERVKQGSKMPLPVLDYTANQEGRHRVAVAKLLGKRTVPVMTVNKMGQEKRWNWLLSNDPKSMEAIYGIPKEYITQFWAKRKKT